MRKEYNPIIPTLERRPSLSPAVSSHPSYDAKRADYVDADRTAGREWRRLTGALSQWEPGLKMYSARKSAEEAENMFATGRDLAMRSENLESDLAAFTQANPEYLGASPTFKKGYQSARLERLGMQFGNDLRETFTTQGWAGLRNPEDLRKAMSEYTASWRQKNLDKYIDDDNLPLVEQYFTASQVQAESSLTGFHAAERLKETVTEGKQEFSEKAFSAIDHIVNAPGQNFFHPANLEAGLTTIAERMMADREDIIRSGLRPYEANALIDQTIIDYAVAMDVGVNDYRGDAILSVLDRVASATGMLGQTARTKRLVAEYQDTAEKRRWQKEDQYWKQRDRNKKLERERSDILVMDALQANPSASVEDIASITNIPLTPDLRNSVGDIKRTFAASTASTYTEANILQTAEHHVALVTGKMTLPELFSTYKRGEINREQYDHLYKFAPRDPAQQEKIQQLAETGGFKEAERTVEEAWKTQLITLKHTPGLEALVKNYFQSTTAKALLKSAVYDGIQTRIQHDLPLEYKDLQDIVSRQAAIFVDPKNTIVIQAAEERMNKNYRFGIMEDARKLSKATMEAGPVPVDEIYKPPETNILTNVSPDVIRQVHGLAVDNGVDPALALALMWHESGGKVDADANINHPESHAYGLMQLQPATAKAHGVNLKDPEQNIIGGLKVIKEAMKVLGITELTTENIPLIYGYYHDGRKNNHSTTAKATGKKIAQLYEQTSKELNEHQGRIKEEKAATILLRQLDDFTKKMKEGIKSQYDAIRFENAVAGRKGWSSPVYDTIKADADSKKEKLPEKILQRLAKEEFDKWYTLSNKNYIPMKDK